MVILWLYYGYAMVILWLYCDYPMVSMILDATSDLVLMCWWVRWLGDRNDFDCRNGEYYTMMGVDYAGYHDEYHDEYHDRSYSNILVSKLLPIYCTRGGCVICAKPPKANPHIPTRSSGRL